MESQKFVEKIYGPYGEAWKIIKILQEADDDNPKFQEVLYHYAEEAGKFSDKYSDNEFAMLLFKALVYADEAIIRMGRNEVQKTETDK